MSEYVEKYDNLLLEFDDLKMFNEELKEKIEKKEKEIKDINLLKNEYKRKR